MSLFMIPGIDDQNVDSTILTLARNVDQVAKEFDLLKMSHIADLVWIVGELKAVLASWGESEILNEMTKERVLHLTTALNDKIKES